MRTNSIAACFLSGLIIFLFNSCSKEKTFDCVKSTGDIVKEDRYFEGFSVLYVEDNINVVLLDDVPGKIIVEAGANLLPKIKCVQDGTKITISNKNTCNWVRSYHKQMTVYVGVAQVKEINQTGYGKITNGEYLKTDTLRVYSLTYGDTDLSIDADFVGFIADDHSSFCLRGNSKKIAGSSAVNAYVDTKEMKTKWVTFTSNSMLDANLYCDSILQAEIDGNGNVFCNGHPGIVEYKRYSGNGTLQFP